MRLEMEWANGMGLMIITDYITFNQGSYVGRKGYHHPKALKSPIYKKNEVGKEGKGGGCMTVRCCEKFLSFLF